MDMRHYCDFKVQANPNDKCGLALSAVHYLLRWTDSASGLRYRREFIITMCGNHKKLQELGHIPIKYEPPEWLMGNYPSECEMVTGDTPDTLDVAIIMCS